MAAKLQQKIQNQARQMKQICPAKKESPKSTSHLSWLFMRLFMTATYFTYTHPLPWVMASVLIAARLAARYIAGISGQFRICPFLVSGWSCILRFASSSATTTIAAGRPLPSSPAMKCSATEDVPAGVRERWHVTEYQCHQALPAVCFPIWAYPSARLRSCATCTG